MDAKNRSGQGFGHPDHSSINQSFSPNSSTETQKPCFNIEQAIAHLNAAGFKPGDKVWMRLWVSKGTSIELAKRLKLAYQDKKTKEGRHSNVNGFLTLGEGQKATFTEYFGTQPKLHNNGWHKLIAWNHKGFNVGFIPNRGGRKDADITECWCLFYEIDDRIFRDQFRNLHSLEAKLGRKATFVLRTRKSLHCWFRLSEKISPDVWTDYQKRLALLQESDGSLSDTSQVMRLAGSLHQSVETEAALLWEGFHAGTLPEDRANLTEKQLLKGIWDSIPVEIIQDTGEVFELEEFDRILPELEPQPKARKYKDFERSFRFPHPEPIPLEVCLSRDNRKVLEQGQAKGNRNQAGFALACDLLGVADYLTQQGQSFAGDPAMLFQDYCDRCHPPLPDSECQSIWDSASKEPREATLSLEYIENCVKGHVWQQEKAKQLDTGVSDSSETDTESDKKSTLADLLLEIAEQATFFHTSDKVAYADVPIKETRGTYAVKSKAFKQWLIQQLYTQHNRTVGSETLNQVLGKLEAQAVFDGEEREVYLRLAEYQGKIYLDLGTDEWTAIAIDSNGWQIVADYPVRFRRADIMRPLPMPDSGGNLAEFQELLNLDVRDWVLVISWLLFCFYPNHPHPILILHGEQGSGKSYTARMLKSLIDPCKSPLIPNIADLRNLAVQANNRWLLAYDNLSGLKNDQSDALCRISTGGGFSTRTLYENDQETVFEFIRPQILTGIDSLATRGDLLERSILVKLPTIPESHRVTEAELTKAFSELSPFIFGALLNALSQTLKALPTVNPGILPRMADFARFAIAAESALGLEPGSFMAAYQGNRQEAHETALESSPVAVAIQRFVATHQRWQGTATELLDELNKLIDEKTQRSKAWVGNAKGLGKALTRLAPDLRGIGIEVTQTRTHHARIIRLEKVTKQTSPTSPTSQPSQGKASESDVPEESDVTDEWVNVTRDMNHKGHHQPSTNVTPNVTVQDASEKGFQQSDDNGDVSDKTSPALSKLFQLDDLVTCPKGKGKIVRVDPENNFYMVEGESFQSWFPAIHVRLVTSD